MRLKISHTTSYSYDKPVTYALQQLRLIPRTGHGQTVVNWVSEITGGTKQLSFDDQFTNQVELVQMDEGAELIRIVSQGEVETENRDGVIGRHRGYAPLWLYKSPTDYTAPGPQIRNLAREFGASSDIDPLDRLHTLSAAIQTTVAYATGRTDSATTAEMALAPGHGVCQDHAHIMIAAARLLDHPARYISGYLMMDSQVEQDASHAWAEVWLDSLGWVGFDISNAICPDERYVRVAVGRDYRDAAPVHGLRMGEANEALQVSLQVQQ